MRKRTGEGESSSLNGVTTTTLYLSQKNQGDDCGLQEEVRGTRPSTHRGLSSGEGQELQIPGCHLHIDSITKAARQWLYFVSCLRRLADPTVKDLIGGFTALHYAAMHGRARIARLMLESEHRPDIINAKSNDGWTPLHVAAHYGRDSFVKLLLEFKAEVDPLSDKGTTPLQLAIIRERSSCVKILLDHNANIDIQNGFLLRYAVIKSNHSYCRMFLQRGADTNLGRLEDGQTPFHLSALKDDVLCARMLYNYGADCNTRNYEGQTPLAVSVSLSGTSRPCLDFLQEVTRQPRNLQDLCRIKIRQCIGLQNLKGLEALPLAKVMKDYVKHKFDDI
ncbi:ankyrin repeat and SOCS box protein 7 isoform X3 [Narcine bancroftii]|uniref:ankyrin repeat and SOCS box protein 7 isoform X3 n=1 Tax=Narcine bancroftii TaxID=1343680 RepID=UPI003831ABDA